MNAPSTANFTFNQVWDNTLAMLRAHAGLLSGLAGVFLFLPGVLLSHFVPPPEGTAPEEFVEAMVGWWQANAHWVVLAAIVNMIGVIAIYLLLLRPPGVSVGGAVASALPILPFYIVLTIIINIAISLGFALLIVPGIYLLGRLSLASPVLVAEMPRAPFSAIGRAWELSRGRGWQIALLVALIYIASLIINVAVTSSLGVVILLVLGNEGVGGLLVAIINALVGAATTVVATVLIASIYRAVTAGPDLGKRFS